MSESEEKEEKVEEEKVEEVTIKKSDYDTILQRITKLEAEKEVLTQLRKPVEEEEEQYTPPQKKVKDDEEVDFSTMTPEQFYNHIVETVGKPLTIALMTQQVRSELRDAKREHEDFKEFEKDVEKVCMNNPNMSVEDAYIYIKAKREGIKPKAKTEDLEPQKIEKKPPLGEKPVVTGGALKQGAPKTLREAILMADKEIHEEK